MPEKIFTSFVSVMQSCAGECVETSVADSRGCEMMQSGCLQSHEMRPVHHYKQTLSVETTVV